MTLALRQGVPEDDVTHPAKKKKEICKRKKRRRLPQSLYCANPSDKYIWLEFGVDKQLVHMTLIAFFAANTNRFALRKLLWLLVL